MNSQSNASNHPQSDPFPNRFKTIDACCSQSAFSVVWRTYLRPSLCWARISQATWWVHMVPFFDYLRMCVCITVTVTVTDYLFEQHITNVFRHIHRQNRYTRMAISRPWIYSADVIVLTPFQWNHSKQACHRKATFSKVQEHKFCAGVPAWLWLSCCHPVSRGHLIRTCSLPLLQ